MRMLISSLFSLHTVHRIARVLRNPAIMDLFSPRTTLPALISNELDVVGYSAVNVNVVPRSTMNKNGGTEN